MQTMPQAIMNQNAGAVNLFLSRNSWYAPAIRLIISCGCRHPVELQTSQSLWA
jgi:hypothetical protein